MITGDDMRLIIRAELLSYEKPPKHAFVVITVKHERSKKVKIVLRQHRLLLIFQKEPILPVCQSGDTIHLKGQSNEIF